MFILLFLHQSLAVCPFFEFQSFTRKFGLLKKGVRASNLAKCSKWLPIYVWQELQIQFCANLKQRTKWGQLFFEVIFDFFSRYIYYTFFLTIGQNNFWNKIPIWLHKLFSNFSCIYIIMWVVGLSFFLSVRL